MIAKVTAWFLDLVIRVFTALWDFFVDLLINILDMVVNGLGALISALPAPTFLSTYSIGTLINMMPSYVLYFASHFRIGEAMLVIGAGFTFRMARKIFTLGQW